MSDAVNLNKPSTRTDYLANARKGWGDALPDWVLVLAEEASRSSGIAVAQRLGYSPAVITQVIYSTYTGNLGGVEQKVRGAYMGAVVMCPVLDEIGRDRCLKEQKKKFAVTSAVRTKLFRACRSGCPHSRLAKSDREGGADV